MADGRDGGDAGSGPARDAITDGVGHVPNGGTHDALGDRMLRASPLLEEAWRYWSSLRPPHGLPRRADLDPARMQFILGHAMVVEHVRPGTVRIRLGGPVTEALMGMDVRGLPIRAFFDAPQRGEATRLFERMFRTPAALDLRLAPAGDHGEACPDRPAARMLVLPLADRTGGVTKALATIATGARDVRPPRRFAITSHTLWPLHVTAGRPMGEKTPPPPPGFAEAAPGPVPWLRIVK